MCCIMALHGRKVIAVNTIKLTKNRCFAITNIINLTLNVNCLIVVRVLIGKANI